jgi:hypothetical protein
MYSNNTELNSEILRKCLRIFATAMLSIGIYTMLSGGVVIVSSTLIIALGSLWLKALVSPGSLQTNIDELAKKDSRGCCRHCCSGMCRSVFDNIRGLAISAITIGCFEFIIFVVFFTLQANYFSEYFFYGCTGGNCYNCYQYNLQNTRQFSCYTGNSDDYCYIYYNPSFLYSYNSYSIPCYAGSTRSYCYVTLPDTITPRCGSAVFDKSNLPLVKWLFYAVGNTAIAAPLNIAFGAISLQLIDALTIQIHTGESTALLPNKNIATSLMVR